MARCLLHAALARYLSCSSNLDRSALTRETIVHVGFQKTATTSIQALWSAHVPNYFGRPYARSGRDAMREIATLSLCCDQEFDASVFTALLNSARRGDETLLFSDELCIPSPWSWEESARPNGAHSLPAEEIARRLHRAIPGAKILVTIRAQPALIRSYYAQALRNGSRETYEQFAEKLLRQVDRADAASMDYRCVADLYCEVFGADRVVLAPIEQLLLDPRAFWGRLGEALETQVFSLLGDCELPHENPTVLSPGRLDLLLNRILRSRYRPERGLPWPFTRARYQELILEKRRWGKRPSEKLFRGGPALSELLQRLQEANRELSARARWFDLTGIGYPGLEVGALPDARSRYRA